MRRKRECFVLNTNLACDCTGAFSGGGDHKDWTQDAGRVVAAEVLEEENPFRERRAR